MPEQGVWGVGCRMVSPVCTTRNMGGFIAERVGRETRKGDYRDPCFPHEGQCRATACLGQENWQGTEIDLKGKGGRGVRRQGLQEAAGVDNRGSPARGIRNSGKRSSLSSCYGMNLQVEF